MIRAARVAVLLLLGAGCATKGQVRLVEQQVATLRVQTARQDSARAAELGRVMALQQRILDSLRTTRESLRQEVGQGFLEVQQQLVQIQELTGQSQRRLAELKRQLDDRSEQLAVVPDTVAPPVARPADTTVTAPPVAPPRPSAPSVPTPDQLYQASLQELRRGSLGAARAGFREFLKTYPTHAQVPDALYFVGETFAVDQPDSASAYYRQVVERYRASERAPTALYKTGLLAERSGNRDGARGIYQQVVQQYPRSREADLARDRLANLRP
jgi:tol-pal system protein YbgF